MTGQTGFTAPATKLDWCGDLTAIRTEDVKLYLADVKGLASRRIAGFALSEPRQAAGSRSLRTAAAAVRGGDLRRSCA